MDGEDLDIADNSYDVALCSLGLLYYPDPLQGLTEMYRVLKTTGRAVAAVWGKRKNCGWGSIFPIIESRIKSDVCPLFFQLGTGNLLEHSFVQAGFKDIKCERISTHLHFDS